MVLCLLRLVIVLHGDVVALEVEAICLSEGCSGVFLPLELQVGNCIGCGAVAGHTRGVRPLQSNALDRTELSEERGELLFVDGQGEVLDEEV